MTNAGRRKTPLGKRAASRSLRDRAVNERRINYDYGSKNTKNARSLSGPEVLSEEMDLRLNTPVRAPMLGSGRTKRVGGPILKSVVLLAIANLNFVNAQAQKAPQPVAQVGEKTDSTTHNLPQDFVVCTGRPL